MKKLFFSVLLLAAFGCSKDEDGSESPASFTMSIIASGPVTLCSGGSVTLTASAANSYSWSNGSTSSSIIVSTPGTYSVTGTDVNGDTASSSAVTVTVNPYLTPAISISANPYGNISPTTTVTFTATISNGGTNPSYQWKKNGINVGTNSSTYSSAGWINGDVVTCTLTTNATCATASSVASNSISMVVNSPALQVVYELDCPDCYVYCKGPNGAAQNFYHQNSSWTYSYNAGPNDTLVLIAQNTSGAPASVAGRIRLNGVVVAGDTSYCPISGVVIVGDTL